MNISIFCIVSSSKVKFNMNGSGSLTLVFMYKGSDLGTKRRGLDAKLSTVLM